MVRPRAPSFKTEPFRSRKRRLALAVPRDGAGKPVVEVDLRLEPEEPARLVDVRDADLHVGVVKGLEDELARRAGQPLHPRGQVEDRHRRARVADVEGLPHGPGVLEAEQERVDHVVDVAPRADLRAVAVDDEVGAREGRLDERANGAAGDRGRVDDVRRAAGELADRLGVEHVALDEGQVRVLGELGARERVAVEVVEGDDLVVVDEPPGEGGRDEAGSAGDEDPLPSQHAASLPRKCFPALSRGFTRDGYLRRVRRIPLVVVLLALLGVAGSAGGGVPVPPPPGDQLPTWSPDGSVIVFLSDRDGKSLRVMNPDGSGEHRIPWLPANTSYSFSRDWTHIAAVVNGRLVVERLDGTDRRRLGPATYLARASWSPDGTRVAFTAPSATPNQADVLVTRIDGTETHRVAVGVYPAWSPSGERIAYVAGEYGKNELHLVNADPSGDVPL